MADVARAHTLWEEGTEPGRRVVALGAAGALTVAVLDLLFTGGLGWLFEVGFVVCCVAAALLVRPRDFFTVALLPPLLMVGLLALLALAARDRIADERDGLVQAVIAGLAHHAGGLAAGYLLCLACLEVRRRVLLGQASNRPASPAPRRRTTGAPSE